MLELKIRIFESMNKSLDAKIFALGKNIQSLEESRDNETKSSVGDKYETGRAMIHIEIENNLRQLQNFKNQKKELSQLKLKSNHAKVDLGSLVVSTEGVFFISIGMGKIIIDDKKYFAISKDSPIGKLIWYKEIGDSFEFRNRTFLIREIH